MLAIDENLWLARHLHLRSGSVSMGCGAFLILVPNFGVLNLIKNLTGR
jgi:hypothetical protein